jgi:prevent-host-death family protein
MSTFTVQQAKTQLSKLLAKVEVGEEVVIARGSKPIARLVPFELKTVRAKAGAWKDRSGFAFSESFFDPLPDDELALWNGEGDDG